MRTSHNSYENSSDDSSDDSRENGKESGLSADRLHNVPAHIPLKGQVEHASVPMPPRIERVPLPTLFNAEMMATELHVERQAPDPDNLHESDGSELLYDRHVRDEQDRRDHHEADDSDSAEHNDDSEDDEDTDKTDTKEGSGDDGGAPKRPPAKLTRQRITPLFPLPAEAAQPEAAETPVHSDPAASPTPIQPAVSTPQGAEQGTTQAPFGEQAAADPYAPVGPLPPRLSTVPGQNPNTSPNTPLPNPNTQTLYYNQMPSHSPNVQAPAPPVQGPPPPPVSPPGGAFNAPPPPPSNPNSYGTVGYNPYNPNYYPPTPAAPQYNANAQYNQPPAAPTPHVPDYGRHGIDTLARLGVVGNFIGNRRTRKRLGKQINENQKKSSANFADIKAQQTRLEQAQNQQTHQMQQLQRGQLEQRAAAASYAGPEQQIPAAYIPPQEQYYQQPQPPAAVPAPRSESTPYPASPDHNQSAPRPEQQFAAAMPEIRQPQYAVEQQPPAAQYQPPEQASGYNPNATGARVAPELQKTSSGDEMQRERRHEVIADHVGGGLGLAASTQAVRGAGGSHPQYQTGLPSGMTTPTLPQGNHIDPQHQLTAHTKKSGMPGLAFWVMLAIIVAAFFAAALI